jgi:hypothetical protein
MIPNHQFAILLPLAVGIIAVECTIFVHVIALATTVNLFRYEKRLGRLGADALNDLAIITLVISVAFVAHLAEIGLWAVNYTTLGYGDILLSPAWRLLGPLEATNGVLMFGVSAAVVFAAIQRLVLARFQDLRN